jgi:alkylated DNA repair dioxygenase AlkB
MLTIPSGSITIVPDVAFVVRDFVTCGAADLYISSSPHLKETGSKSRSMARYGVPYTYKGHPLPTFGWTLFLEGLRVKVEAALGVPFNAAVVNRYKDGTQGVPPHSDARAIPQLGKQPIIAGVSFGATRQFVLQGLKKVDQPIITDVNHGDLVVMYGRSQSHYRHSVPTVLTHEVSPRWSVTYRHHIITVSEPTEV